MRIDIKPINSKQREVVNHVREYIELEADYILYSVEQVTREWEESEDVDSIDNYISAEQTEKIINRSLHLKLKKYCVKGVWTYRSEANEAWATSLLNDMTDEIIALFENEREARNLFDILDNWIFNEH